MNSTATASVITAVMHRGLMECASSSDMGMPSQRDLTQREHCITQAMGPIMNTHSTQASTATVN